MQARRANHFLSISKVFDFQILRPRLTFLYLANVTYGLNLYIRKRVKFLIDANKKPERSRDQIPASPAWRRNDQRYY